MTSLPIFLANRSLRLVVSSGLLRSIESSASWFDLLFVSLSSETLRLPFAFLPRGIAGVLTVDVVLGVSDKLA